MTGYGKLYETDAETKQASCNTGTTYVFAYKKVLKILKILTIICLGSGGPSEYVPVGKAFNFFELTVLWYFSIFFLFIKYYLQFLFLQYCNLRIIYIHVVITLLYDILKVNYYGIFCGNLQYVILPGS